jgi:hypothetical protein
LIFWVVAVNPFGPVHEYALIPPIALKVVFAPGQIAFVPVMVQLGSGFTFKLAKLEVCDPHVPVTITLYLFASAAVTGEIVNVEDVAPGILL